MTNLSTKILGIDPGIVNVGWGIILAPDLSYFRSGSIENNHSKLQAKILATLEQLEIIFSKYSPDLIVYEDPVFNKVGNWQTGSNIHKLLGALFILASRYKIPIYSYSATATKYMIGGHGKAGKTQIQIAVRKLLRMDECYPFSSDHESDALAIAATHWLKSSVPS